MEGLSIRIVKEWAIIDGERVDCDACLSAYYATKRAVPDLMWKEHVKWWREFQSQREINEKR